MLAQFGNYTTRQLVYPGNNILATTSSHSARQHCQMEGPQDLASLTAEAIEDKLNNSLSLTKDIASRREAIELVELISTQCLTVMTEKTFNECWCLLRKYGKPEASTTLAFAYLKLNPEQIAAHLRTADSCELPRLAKRAMNHYSEAANLALESNTESEVLPLCIRGILRCSQYTDFGPQLQEGEISDLKADPEFYTDTANNFSNATLCRGVQEAYADLILSNSVDDAITSLLSLSSNHRLSLPSAQGLYKLPRFFRWLVPFRLAIMGIPRSAADIVILRERFGISTIVTLTQEQPLPEEWFEDGLSRNIFIPVRDFSAPKAEQVDDFIKTVTNLPDDEAALIHCGAGKGRAGTFAACYLMACGLQAQTPTNDTDQYQYMFPAEAIRLVRHMRPGSIESTEQTDFIKEYGNRLSRSGLNTLPSETETVEEPTTPLDIVVGVLKPRPSLVVCCGLQGSGKSTFATQLAENLDYTLISQDTLGSRSTCFAAMANAVQDGKRVVVDLCNPKPDDRAEWLACAFNPEDAVCAYFDIPREICIQRANARTDHQTIAQGRAKRIIMSLSKTFVQPTQREKFACIARIGSVNAANEMLGKLGVSYDSITSSSVAETPSEMPKPMIPAPPWPSPQPVQNSQPTHYKFPRTKHLLNVGAATEDDRVLRKAKIGSFLDTSDPLTTVTFEEKVDGANLGFQLDPSTYTGFRAQSRGRLLESGETDKQFQKVDKWILQHADGLRKLLLGPTHDAPPGKYVLYGEWLVARHNIYYDRLPDIFLAFDLYDTENESFLSRQELTRRLESTSIQQVPTVPIPDEVNPRTLMDLVSTHPSQFYDGVVEGVYFRRERNGNLIDRTKMVRSDFKAGNPNFERGFTENIVLEK